MCQPRDASRGWITIHVCPGSSARSRLDLFVLLQADQESGEDDDRNDHVGEGDDADLERVEPLDLLGTRAPRRIEDEQERVDRHPARHRRPGDEERELLSQVGEVDQPDAAVEDGDRGDEQQDAGDEYVRRQELAHQFTHQEPPSSPIPVRSPPRRYWAINWMSSIERIWPKAGIRPEPNPLRP